VGTSQKLGSSKFARVVAGVAQSGISSARSEDADDAPGNARMASAPLNSDSARRKTPTRSGWLPRPVHFFPSWEIGDLQYPDGTFGRDQDVLNPSTLSSMSSTRPLHHGCVPRQHPRAQWACRRIQGIVEREVGGPIPMSATETVCLSIALMGMGPLISLQRYPESAYRSAWATILACLRSWSWTTSYGGDSRPSDTAPAC